jgi:long-chain fatty acid adenylase/transferase FadD26
MTGRPIPCLLEDLARDHPDDTAYTFVDYGVDPLGVAESLTWQQVHHRACIVADRLASCGSPGDRAAIVAHQGLDYVVAFLGAIQAGFIAVPLSVPQFGAHDERVSGALHDCSPVAILTTSAVVDGLLTYAAPQPGRAAPAIIEVDVLDVASAPTVRPVDVRGPKTAYLQYTSGSTRRPSGVMITHENAVANVHQIHADFLDGDAPNLTVVSWLPLFHDLGLVVGLFIPLVTGRPGVLFSPVAFMQKPGRWITLLASHPETLTAAPNFAFDLAARRTSDEELAGLDLSNVRTIASGSERIHATTLRRFWDRFVPFGLPATAVRPAFGLAEATVYVVCSLSRRLPTITRFDYQKLCAGHAEVSDEEGIEMVGLGPPRSCLVRIVDPHTDAEVPANMVGEVWLNGPNVATGYWRNAALSDDAFGASLVDATPGTPVGPWVRTGDLGVMSEGELFVVGRIKDMLIVNGRNHYPDDIEVTISEITGGRVAAISVQGGQSEQLVVIAELKRRADESDPEVAALRRLRRDVTAAVATVHNLRLADLVLVRQGSIPITTSGKVRRAHCLDRYQRSEFRRLDDT